MYSIICLNTQCRLDISDIYQHMWLCVFVQISKHVVAQITVLPIFRRCEQPEEAEDSEDETKNCVTIYKE